MLLLFATTLALGALGGPLSRDRDALRRHLVITLKALALESARNQERIERGEIDWILKEISGKGWPDPFRYHRELEQALADPSMVRWLKVLSLMEYDLPTGARMAKAAGLAPEMVEISRLIFLQGCSNRVTTFLKALGPGSGLGEVQGMEGWTWVDGSENHRTWMGLLKERRPHPMAWASSERSSFPAEWAPLVNDGRGAILGINSPDRDGVAWFVSGVDPGDWIWMEPKQRIGDVDWSSFTQALERATLERFPSWPRVPGQAVGTLENGWEVVPVSREQGMDWLEALPDGSSSGRPRHYGGSWRPVLDNQGSREHSWFALRDPWNGANGLIGVFSLDAWGSPNPAEAIDLDPRFPPEQGFTTWFDRTVFPRIHRTVSESVPSSGPQRAEDWGGAITTRGTDPRGLWLDLMEQATALAAKTLSVPVLRGPRSDLPTVAEVKEALKDAGGSSRNLRKKHLVAAFMEKVPEAVQWAEAHGIPQQLVKVRLSGGEGEMAHTVLEGDGGRWGVSAVRRDRLTQNDSGPMKRVREGVHGSDEPILEVAVKVPTWSRWFSDVFLERPSQSRISWNRGEPADWKSWQAEGASPTAPYYDPYNFGYFVVDREDLQEKTR